MWVWTVCNSLFIYCRINLWMIISVQHGLMNIPTRLAARTTSLLPSLRLCYSSFINVSFTNKLLFWKASNDDIQHLYFTFLTSQMNFPWFVVNLTKTFAISNISYLGTQILMKVFISFQARFIIIDSSSLVSKLFSWKAGKKHSNKNKKCESWTQNFKLFH